MTFRIVSINLGLLLLAEVDHEKYLSLLKESNKGYYTYQELRDYIIPNIKVAIQNLHLADDKKIDYNDEFESNWDLYGIKELEGKRDEYKKQILDILAAYQKEWNQPTNEEPRRGLKRRKNL